jgi:hypothetical protein
MHHIFNDFQFWHVSSKLTKVRDLPQAEPNTNAPGASHKSARRNPQTGVAHPHEAVTVASAPETLLPEETVPGRLRRSSKTRLILNRRLLDLLIPGRLR